MPEPDESENEGLDIPVGPERTIKIKTDDLILDSYEGQNELIMRLEKAVADNPDINYLDLKIVTTLKDLAKIKKDLDVLKMYKQLREEIDKIKEARVAI